jgi:hypothetical protein
VTRGVRPDGRGRDRGLNRAMEPSAGTGGRFRVVIAGGGATFAVAAATTNRARSPYQHLEVF